jgi:hypothetical protein
MAINTTYPLAGIIRMTASKQLRFVDTDNKGPCRRGRFKLIDGSRV